MTVDDAEIMFGKRWNKWSEQETLEFVKALQPENLNIPFTLNLAMGHFEKLPEQTQKKMRELGYRS